MKPSWPIPCAPPCPHVLLPPPTSHQSPPIRVLEQFSHGSDSDKALLDQMPLSLRRAVLADIYMTTLRRTPIFVGCPKLQIQLCSIMSRTVCLSGDKLCKQGDVASELYVLETGLLKLTFVEEAKEEEEEGDKREGTKEEGGGEGKVLDQGTRKGTPSVRGARSGRSGAQEPPPLLDAAHPANGTEGTEGAAAAADILFGEAAQAASSTGGGGGLSRLGSLRRRPPPPPSISATSKATVKLIRHRGNVACEPGFFFNVRQPCTVEAAAPSSCLVAVKSEFERLAKDLPDELARVREAVLAQLQRSGDPSIREIEQQRRTARPREEVARLSDLLFAAASGEVEMVRRAISQGSVDVNAVDYEGRSALMIAASAGSLGVVEYLIQQKAALSVLDAFGKSALSNAVQRGHRPVADLLHKHGAELGWNKSTAAAELCAQARLGNLSKVRSLIEYGADANAADYDARTCLHIAASEGNLPIVEYLITEGKATINCVDRWGGTPLADAICHAHANVAHRLIGHGGRLEWDEAKASAELCETARKGDVYMVELLLSAGCSIEAADYDARTCLHIAAAEGALSVVGALLQHRAEVNQRDRWGGTPLRDAVRGGHLKVATLLFERGGTLGYTEPEASSELCELARRGSLDTIKLMRACGVSVHAADYDARTCLHIAASEGNLPIVEYLITEGKATINCVDRWGGTPLADAICHAHANVAHRLIGHGGRLEWDEVKASAELCETARKGDVYRLELLLTAGCSINSRDYDLRSALHVAASEGALKQVELLVKHGANLSARDRWNGTPLRDALRAGHDKVAAFLHSKGGTLGLTSREIAAELCALAGEGHADRIAALLKVGADVNATEWDGRTAVQVAVSSGNRHVTKLLKAAGALLDTPERLETPPGGQKSGERNLLERILQA